jgi:tRNA nucleotidyltransferase (CCA-adding enzyme)
MNELNLLQFISPEIRLTHDVESLLEETKEVISWYNLLDLEEPFEAWQVYWHGLTSLLNAKVLKALVKKMGMADLDSRKMISQREKANSLLDSLYKFNGDNYHLYTLLLPYDTETLLYLMAKANNVKVKQVISSYFAKLKGTRIQIRGEDLLGMGFQPGPIFKEIFDRLLEARLNNLIKTKEDEIKFVENTFGN